MILIDVQLAIMDDWSISVNSLEIAQWEQEIEEKPKWVVPEEVLKWAEEAEEVFWDILESLDKWEQENLEDPIWAKIEKELNKITERSNQKGNWSMRKEIQDVIDDFLKKIQ